MFEQSDGQATVGRLSGRLDTIAERQDHQAERTEAGFERIFDQLDRISSELAEGSMERGRMMGKVGQVHRDLGELRDRITMIEDTQSRALIGQAAVAGSVAKSVAKTAAAEATVAGNTKFWELAKSRALIWMAGIAAAGASIAALDDIVRFLERLWTAVKGPSA